MSEEELAAIEARVAAATPGPWEWNNADTRRPRWYLDQDGDTYPRAQSICTVESSEADAAFIAAARSNVAALLAEVRRLQAALTDCTDELTQCQDALSEAWADSGRVWG